MRRSRAVRRWASWRRIVFDSRAGWNQYVSDARSRGRTAVDKCLFYRFRGGDAPEKTLEILLHLAFVHVIQPADGVDGRQHLDAVCTERFGRGIEGVHRATRTSIQAVGHAAER